MATVAPTTADSKVAEVKQEAAFKKKISKKKKEQPSELEQKVAQALLELEASNKDLAAELADVFITAAKEVDVEKTKKAVAVFLPFRQYGKFKKIHSRVVRELEKKLNKQVVIVAQRTILSKAFSRRHKGEARPRSRTLTTVHNAVLEDLVYPVAIVGKRVRVTADGKRTLKVLLDPKDIKDYEHKTKTFQAVYSKLTHKNCEFLFEPVA